MLIQNASIDNWRMIDLSNLFDAEKKTTQHDLNTKFLEINNSIATQWFIWNLFNTCNIYIRTFKRRHNNILSFNVKIYIPDLSLCHFCCCCCCFCYIVSFTLPVNIFFLNIVNWKTCCNKQQKWLEKLFFYSKNIALIQCALCDVK